MPTFEYTAEQQNGETVSGRAFGTSLDQVSQQLAARGLSVTQIGVAASIGDPLAPTRSTERPKQFERVQAGVPPDEAPPTHERSYLETSVLGPLFGKVKLENHLFFFRQAATMLDAGVPIVQTMTTLSGQMRDPKMKEIVTEVKEHVRAGRPISAGLQRYPEVFTPVMVSLIRAGEEGGFLDRALDETAQHVEREIELRNLYRRITFYPKLQIAASILIILIANAIISSIGTGTKLWSPLTTPATWIWLGPLLIFIFFFMRLGLANPRLKYQWDILMLRIPGYGKTMRELAMARFGRAFGALYRGGVPVAKALPMAADACGNEFLRSRMYPAYRQLEAGQGIHETFVATGAFNPIVLDMVHTGETTGNLDEMLQKMATYYEGEAATRSVQLGHIMGVAIGLCVAIYIGFIVINFWSGYGAGVTEAANK